METLIGILGMLGLAVLAGRWFKTRKNDKKLPPGLPNDALIKPMPTKPDPIQIKELLNDKTPEEITIAVNNLLSDLFPSDTSSG